VKAKDVELTDKLKRYSLSSMQQYRTRYLLAKLTQHVDMAYQGTKTPSSLENYMSLEIEHILPNNPQDVLHNDFITRNPEKNYDEYKNLLGNFTLLEKPINIVAGNDFFVKKCEEYKKSKYYLTSSIAQINIVGNDSSINRINKRLKSFTEWTADTINERQAMLIDLIKDVWVIRDYE
jgi:hypothetical protein